MLVKATNMSAKLKVRIKELHRIAAPGEEFEVSEARFEVLSGKNKYKAVFVLPVEPVKEPEVVEEVVNEPVAEVEEVVIEEVEEPVAEPILEEEPKKLGRGRRKVTEQQDASE